MSFSYSSPTHPCVLCRGTTDCRVSPSGTIHCRRTPPFSPPPGYKFLKEDTSGFNVFAAIAASDDVLSTETARRLRIAEHINNVKPSQRKAKKEAGAGAPPTTTFATILANMREMTDAERMWLSRKLHVAPAAIASLLYTMWRDRRDELVFVTPERNGAGEVVSCNTRNEAGDKRTHGRGGPGPDRGLFIPAAGAWRPRPGEPLLAVEGASDTLAWLTMGRGVIGRPSNRGGIEYLADFLKSQNYTGRVIIVGENDRKDDGSWPGLTGAEASALRLAKLYDGPVAYALPPAGFKDSREYLKASIVDNNQRMNNVEAEEWGTALLAQLVAAAVSVESITIPAIPAPTEKPSVQSAQATSTTVTFDMPVVNQPDRWYLTNPHLPADTPLRRRPACTQPRGIYFSHRDRYIDRVTWHDCERLDCAGCGPKKRELWCSAFRRHLTAHANQCTDQPLYLFHVTLGKQWRTVHRFLAGARYFRVNLNGDGHCLVVAESPPGPQIDPAHVQMVTPEGAIGRLCSAVMQIPKLHKSKLVTSCREWPIEEKKTPNPKPQWRRICSVAATMSDAMQILRHRNAQGMRAVASEGQIWDWHGVEFIRDFGDVMYEHVSKEIVLGQILPTSYTKCEVLGDEYSPVGDTGPPEPISAW